MARPSWRGRGGAGSGRSPWCRARGGGGGGKACGGGLLWRGVVFALVLLGSVVAVSVVVPVAFAQSQTPDAPTAVAVYSIESQKLEVRWSSSDASTTSFKVQWKSASEEFDSSRRLARTANPVPQVIPSLREWTGESGIFTLSTTSRIVIDSAATTTSTTLHGITTDINYTAQNFTDELQMLTGISLPVLTLPAANDGDIFLSLLNTRDNTLGDEGYRMTIGTTVAIEANTNIGITYARQTVLQILKQSDNLHDLPRGIATDYPSYPHRSFMLDMGRKYWQMSYLEDTIVRLGWQKINFLHMHLTEHDAFRMNSETFPGLAPEGESYTRTEIDKLQRLAKKHNVVIVPEIDVPGHAGAITKYYEETHNPGQSIRFPLTPETCERMDQSPFGGGSHWNVNYADDTARQFVKDLLSEFAPWFESRYFHIGGDETSFNARCPVLSEYADDHTGGNEGNVLPHFLNEMKDHLATLDKETHIWNGYEHRGTRSYLSTDIVVYFWSGTLVQMRSFLNGGHTVVYAPIRGGYPLYLTPGKNTFPREESLLNARLDTHSNLRGHGFEVWADARTATYDEFFELQAVHARAAFAERMWGGSGSRSTDFGALLDRLYAIGGPLGAVPVTPHSGILKDHWSLHSVSSEDGSNPGTRVFDRNIATDWVTTGGSYPHEIVIDLGSTYNITRVQFIPRFRGAGPNGPPGPRPIDRIGAYEIYVSSDPDTWGAAVATGTVVGTNETDSSVETINLATPKQGRYVRLRGTSPMVAGHTKAAVAEINVHGSFVSAPDRENVAPSFEDRAPTRAVPENARARATVGAAVTATDTDSGDVVTYELSGSDLFTIDSNSGQIRVVATESLDHETAPSHSVIVKASDTSNASDSVTVVIEVTDVNERPDAVADTGTVREDGAVIIDVLANDMDPEDDRSALTLRVTTSARWGRATVNEPANVGERRTITYTPRADYHGSDVFTYEVRDAGSPSLSSTATVSVEVDAVNDPPTFKSATTTRSVSESATGGAKVGAPVTASDVDENDTLTYSLSGSEARFFAIGPRSGQITVGDGVDIATKDTYTVTVAADDSDRDRATVEVTIAVTSGPTTPPITGGGGGGGDAAVVVEIEGASFAAADTETVFTAAVSDDTRISSLRWTVGGPDGFTATSNAPRFSFVAPAGGTYTLSVTVDDTARRTHTGSVTLTVFGDITGHQFVNEILWLAESGITRGCAAHSYCPSNPVTRAQMASFLARALELEAPAQPAGFHDVNPSSAHAANIEALYAAHITTGCTQDPLAYCPKRPVTRAQMATFLTRALELEAPPQPAGFHDVNPSSAHAANIEALYAAHITTGCTQDPLAYCPKRPVTRAQMAAFLNRSLKPATNANPS